MAIRPSQNYIESMQKINTGPISNNTETYHCTPTLKTRKSPSHVNIIKYKDACVMIRENVILATLITLSACQLPNRSDIATDLPPNFDEATIISSSSGLLSEGISKVPGSICVADENTGKCNPYNLIPFQCIVDGTTVEVKPVTGLYPSYHSLITNRYETKLSTPFISAPTSTDYLDEVKASVSATASIKASGSDKRGGYPGIDGIKACLLLAYGPGTYKKVIWIQSANIISVTTSRFTKVSNSFAATGTAFGFNGATYNENSVGMQTIWIGILGSAINIGVVSSPAVAKSSAKVISSSDNVTIIETKVPVTALPAPEVEPIIAPLDSGIQHQSTSPPP